MKSLKNKLVTGLAIGVGALGLAGCAGMNSRDYSNLGLAAQVVGINNPNITPEQAATLGALSGFAYNQSQNQSRIEAGREISNSGENQIAEYKKRVLNEMKIKMKQADELYSRGYISEYNRKKIKLKAEIDTMRSLGQIDEQKYQLYMKALNRGELIKSSKEYFY